MKSLHVTQRRLAELAIFTAVGVFILGAALLSGVGSGTSTHAAAQTGSAASAPTSGAVAAAGSQPGSLAATTQATASATVEAAPSPAVGVAIPDVGQPYELAAASVHDFTLVRDAQAPPFSLQDAMQILDDAGVPFAFGGEYQGQQVTVTAAYGIGTFGHPGIGAIPWIGPMHVPVPGRDIVLDHVANRPIWIVAYGNLKIPGSKGVYDHAAYAVDVQTRTLLYAWTYNGS